MLFLKEDDGYDFLHMRSSRYLGAPTAYGQSSGAEQLRAAFT